MQASAMMQSAPLAVPDPISEHLTQQLLTLVEIATTQDRQIQAHKARCERLERREQAGMVAFTAFFHILDANSVSDLAAMAGVFGSLIGEAQQLDLPEESIHYLRGIETMLRDQHSNDRDAAHSPSGIIAGACFPRATRSDSFQALMIALETSTGKARMYRLPGLLVGLSALLVGRKVARVILLALVPALRQFLVGFLVLRR